MRRRFQEIPNLVFVRKPGRMADGRTRAAAVRQRVRWESDRMFGVDFVLPRKARGPARAPSKPFPPPEPVVPVPETRREGDDPAGRLERLGKRVADCRSCSLAETRKNAVFGEGKPGADVMFVGEAPGADEDKQGRPFVGKAGQLLTKIIEAMGFSREDVYIANVLKCRPPDNREPAPAEAAACRPALEEQVEIVRPRVIVALGGHAFRTLTGATEAGITAARGRFGEYRGIPLMPTFHPSYLLRNEGGKRLVWEDMKKVLDRLGRKAPKKGKKG
jgi:DNA polymerase